MDDEVLRILGRMGVAERFADISRPGLGLQLVDRHQHVLGQFRRLPEASANGYPQANMFHQPELEAVLRARVAELDAITLRSGVEVTAVEIGADDRATLTLRNAGLEEQLVADYVLGADGANSLVRSVIGAQMGNLGFEQRWIVIDGETAADLGHREGAHQVCDTTRAGTYMRIGATQHRWELVGAETAADFAGAAGLDRLEPLLRPWLGTVPIDEVDIVRTADAPVLASMMSGWVAP